MGSAQVSHRRATSRSSAIGLTAEHPFLQIP